VSRATRARRACSAKTDRGVVDMMSHAGGHSRLTRSADLAAHRGTEVSCRYVILHNAVDCDTMYERALKI